MDTPTEFKIKTIDIHSKEWWDKVNGNTYFASRVILNYAMEDEKTIYLRLQYGYDRIDEQQTRDTLHELGYFPV